jgi:hypothetical protein
VFYVMNILFKISPCIVFVMILSLMTSPSPMEVSQSAFAQPSTNTSLTADNNSSYKFKSGYPADGTAERAYDDADLSRAIEAYKFFFPTMVNEAMMQAMPPGDKPNQVGIKYAAGPRHQFFTPNSDTPYALGTLDLKSDGPMVVELPRGNFIGLANDHNMRLVQDMGNIGPDKGQGGKHLILPPGYNGSIPEGYYVGQSPTWKAVLVIRSLSPEGNITQALQALDTIKIYPLSKAEEPVTFHFVDVTNETLINPLLEWEDKLDYWQQLKGVIDNETAPADFRPILGMLQSLGIEKGKPFNPDARLTSILERATNIALDQMRVNAFANREPENRVWNDRNWEWIPIQQFNATTKDMGNAAFLDLQSTDNAYFQAFGASPAMGKREPGAGSLYLVGLRDNSSAFLDGGKNYKLTVPGPVPANLFWSATAYDADTRYEIATDQGRAAIRSLIEQPQPNPDGSFDLYFGPNAPPGKEDQWIKTIPGKGYFVYFRIYGPQAPAFDGTWKLNNIVEIK